MADPLAPFRAEVDRLLAVAAQGLGLEVPLPALEVPPEHGMGELGLPCFTLARSLRKNPNAIALDLASAVPTDGRTWISKVEAVGPYVNFHVHAGRLADVVLADPLAVVRPQPNGIKVLLEHTSANPNGPLHVGRARNPIVGDTLVRLHRAAGYEVDAQYYMDNLGRQVATLSWGKWALDPTTLPAPGRDKIDHDLVRYYQAAHALAKSDADVAAQIKVLVERLESADAKVLEKVRHVYLACFSGMQESLERLGVFFDSIKDESDVVLDGAVADVIARLKQLPIAAVDDNGANYLDLSSLLKGQKDKFFFTRGDGTSVYATRDIAYHAWKARQIATDGILVDVLGEDHRLQSLQVGAALDALSIRRPTVVFYAFVGLPEGKMSTRANRVVFVDDLLDEAAEQAYAQVKARRGDELSEEQLRAIAEAVGVAAVRFNIARIQPEKPIEFRWEEALSFDGDSAPYLMYAHARAASLIRKAAHAHIDVPRVLSAAAGPGEQRLLGVVAKLPAAAKGAVDRMAPQRFAAYALELAVAFNEYYRDHRVLECEDANVQRLRLATVSAAREAMKATLTTLGIPALDEM